MTGAEIRIFVSSPGDVAEERVITARVLERLRSEFAHRGSVTPVFWEHEPLLATETFQTQIPRPSDTDIAVVILWSRLGTRLPAEITREDRSRYASGTEFEFEDAVRGWREQGRPDLLVYRKTAEPAVTLDDEQAVLARLEQKKALDRFVRKWFEDPQEGTPIAAFHPFGRSDEFEYLLEIHLRKLIERLLPEDSEARDAAPARPTWTEGSPFRGLQVFEQRHAPVFFGRTKATGDILNALRRQAAAGHAFVTVLGMSGVGKSSLVRAGVLPLLTQPGVIEGVGLWRSSVMRPASGGDLLATLAGALVEKGALPELVADATSVEELARTLRLRPDSADLLILGALSQAAAVLRVERGLAEQPQARLVLTVDQFEEVFSLESVDRAAFISVLAELAASGRVWVIATLRSDFYPRCAEEPALASLMEGSGQYLVLPPTPAEIGQMIRLPALAAGLRFEVERESGTGLDEVVRDAAVRNPESVPLLEFTLEELFQRRTDVGMLSFAAYESLGGVEGALANRAEALFGALSLREQEVAPELLRALVTVGREEEELVAARRIAVSRLAVDEVRAAVLDQFVAARLLVTDAPDGGEPVIGLAHEALLQHWPRLRRWLQADREFLQARARVADAAEHWLAEERLAELLLPEGRPLAEAQEILATRRAELNELSVDYVEASLARVEAIRERARAGARAKLRRSQIEAGVLALLALLAGIGGWLGFTGQRAAVEETRKIAGRELGPSARRLVGEAPQRATLLALEAFEQTRPVGGADHAAAESLLRDLLAEVSGTPLRDHRRAVSSLAFDAQGRWLATAGGDHEARLWDLAADGGARLARRLAGPADRVLALAFDPRGRWLAGAGKDHSVWLWPVDPAGEPVRLPGHLGAVFDVAFSPDGRWLASASADATVRLWPLTAGGPAPEAIVLAEHTDAALVLAFAADSRRLASGGLDGAVRLWDLTAEPPAATGAVHVAAPVRTLAFDRDTGRLAFGSDGGAVHMAVLDEEGRPRPQSAAVVHDGPVTRIAFGPGGRWLASAGEDARVVLRDLAGEAPPATRVLAGHEGAVRALAFGAQGRWLWTGGEDRTVRAWDLAKDPPEPARHVLRGHDGAVLALALGPGGRRLASASGDRSARLWDLGATRLGAEPIALAANGAAPCAAHGADARLRALAVSRDGRHLAVGRADGGLALWDLAAPATGRSPTAWCGHDGAVAAVGFGPLATQLASAGRDHTVRVWDLENGPAVRARFVPFAPDALVAGHGEKPLVRALAVSADGRWLASVNDAGVARVRDRAGPGAAIHTYDLGHEGDRLRSVAFDPAGRWMVGLGWDDRLRLWSLERLAASLVPAVLDGYEWPVDSAEFSPDGRWLIATDVIRRRTLLWDLAGGAEVAPKSLDRAGGPLGAWAFSPDGRWLALARRTGEVVLRDLHAPDRAPERIAAPGPEGPVLAVTFGAGRRWLALGYDKGAVRVHALGSGGRAPRELWAGNGQPVVALAVAPDSSSLAALTAHGLVLVAASPEPSAAAPLTPDRVFALTRKDPRATPARPKVRYGPHGRWLVATSPAGVVGLVRVAGEGGAPELIDDWPVGAEPVHHAASAAFGRDGRWLASVRAGGEAALWDLAADRPQPLALAPRAGEVTALTLDATGREVITGNADGELIRWWLDSSEPWRVPVPMQEQTDEVSSVAISPDGQQLVAGGTEGVGHRWRIGDAHEYAPLRSGTGRRAGAVLAVGHTGEAAALTIATADGRVRIWPADAGASAAPVREVRLDEASRGLLGWLASVPGEQSGRTDAGAAAGAMVAWAEDGSVLARVEDGHTVRIWDLEGALVARLASERHRNVVAIAVSRDGALAATGHADGTVRLLRHREIDSLDEGVLLTGLAAPVAGLAFSPDGRSLAAGAGDRLYLWLTDPDALAQAACRIAGRSLDPEEWKQHLGARSYRPTCPQEGAGDT